MNAAVVVAAAGVAAVVGVARENPARQHSQASRSERPPPEVCSSSPEAGQAGLPRGCRRREAPQSGVANGRPKQQGATLAVAAAGVVVVEAVPVPLPAVVVAVDADEGPKNGAWPPHLGFDSSKTNTLCL